MDATRRQTGATVLAWRATGPAEPGSGPRRLELGAIDPDDAGGAADLPGPAVPGPGLEALFASSAAVTAAELGLADPASGLDPEPLRLARRVGAHLDAAWAAELGLAVEAPLLDRALGARGSPPPTGPEAAMGAALARALEDGIAPGVVDVSLLRDAAGPLEDLIAALPAWGDGLAPQLILTPDVLHLARCSWRLLHATHQAWFAAHNRALGGDPRRVLHHPVDTWARGLAARASDVIERVHVLRTLDGCGDDLAELVRRHFTWSAPADRQGFATWVTQRTDPVPSLLALTDPAASALAVRLEPLLPLLDDELDLADAVDAVGAYLEAWLLTDAGLLARLHRELHLASDAWAWRRVDVSGGSTAWSLADVPAAARSAATALDQADLLDGGS